VIRYLKNLSSINMISVLPSSAGLFKHILHVTISSLFLDIILFQYLRHCLSHAAKTERLTIELFHDYMVSG